MAEAPKGQTAAAASASVDRQTASECSRKEQEMPIMVANAAVAVEASVVAAEEEGRAAEQTIGGLTRGTRRGL